MTEDRAARINHALPCPVEGWVVAGFLGLDGSRIPARVVAASTYEGEAMALTVVLGGSGPEQGSLFTYLPFDAFSTVQDGTLLPYQELVWEACPGGEVDACMLPTLPERVACLRRLGPSEPLAWEEGRYVMTFDWPRANRMLHLVLLDRGQFASCPNHKMKWGEDAPRALAALRKLRGTWLVE